MCCRLETVGILLLAFGSGILVSLILRSGWISVLVGIISIVIGVLLLREA